MGILDQLGNLQGDLSQAKQGFESIKKVVLPAELQNLINADADLTQKISSFTPATNPNSLKNDLTHMRIELMSHFDHILQGEPLPNPATKAVVIAHPSYQAVKQNFPTLNNQLAVLEKQYLGCTFGFQLADGTIIAPNVGWTEDQYVTLRSQSQHQTARCWLDSDRSQYV